MKVPKKPVKEKRISFSIYSREDVVVMQAIYLRISSLLKVYIQNIFAVLGGIMILQIVNLMHGC